MNPDASIQAIQQSTSELRAIAQMLRNLAQDLTWRTQITASDSPRHYRHNVIRLIPGRQPTHKGVSPRAVLLVQNHGPGNAYLNLSAQADEQGILINPSPRPIPFPPTTTGHLLIRPSGTPTTIEITEICPSE